MSPELPPDQRAVLSLLLRQGKSYEEVAALLNIERRAVRDRAQAALAVLAPGEARELSSEDRLTVGDYLLGQQGTAEREQTQGLLRGSGTARAWAEAIALELSSLTSASLPEIPGSTADRATLASRAQGSRMGGAMLLGGLAVVVIVVVILIVSGGSGGGSHNAAKTTASATATTTSTSSSGSQTPHEDSHAALTPPDASSKATGTVVVLSEGSKRAFYVQTSGLPKAAGGTLYAVWLTSPSAKALPLGLLPAETTNHRVEGGGPLPSNPGGYRRLIVTRETSQHPAHPGETVLAGTFSLG